MRGIGLGSFLRAQKRGKLYGELGARHRVTILNNFQEYSGIKTGLGFTTHNRANQFIFGLSQATCEALIFGSPRLLIHA